jgi:hypothetical protein
MAEILSSQSGKTFLENEIKSNFELLRQKLNDFLEGAQFSEELFYKSTDNRGFDTYGYDFGDKKLSITIYGDRSVGYSYMIFVEAGTKPTIGFSSISFQDAKIDAEFKLTNSGLNNRSEETLGYKF